jgi:hypothetical protein
LLEKRLLGRILVEKRRCTQSNEKNCIIRSVMTYSLLNLKYKMGWICNDHGQTGYSFKNLVRKPEINGPFGSLKFTWHQLNRF